MPPEKPKLQNLVHVDDAQLDKILEQLPCSSSILENVKATFGISVKVAKFEIMAAAPTNSKTTNKIKQLEKYLKKNGLINTSRPLRTPHTLLNGSHYWWVKETFVARRVVIPAPVLLKEFGVSALAVWISDPKQTSRPTDESDWTGSFLYLPTIHYESGKSAFCLSGCSALQFIVNASRHRPLFERDWNEPFGRNSSEHPIEKLARIGGFVTEERKLESLYYVRYMTNEQVYSLNGIEIRTNDVVGYPIYISAFPSMPSLAANKRLQLAPKNLLKFPDVKIDPVE